MKVEWIIDDDVRLDPSMMEKMKMVADLAPKVEGLSVPCAISVRICRDGVIAAINQQWRGLNRSTDVLSFPSVSWPGTDTARQHEHLLHQVYDDEAEACFLGDIIISLDHVYQQASEYQHSPEREAAYLLTHGICHLMGYDHLDDSGRRQMRQIEEQILGGCGMSRNGSGSGEFPESFEELIDAARKAQLLSYSPYSRFGVGAALRTVDGRVFTGCNIENASYGLTNCAERTAVFKAVSEGYRQFDAIAIAADQIAWPCGACRQVLNEFAPELLVIVADAQGSKYCRRLSELLPEGFGPDKLL